MPSPVPFRVIRKKLEDHGWKLDRTNGSHFIFAKAGSGRITVPVHRNQVKPVYVRLVEKTLREDAQRQKDAADE
ncbi:MAG: type II toxin-antitoxin system HicA family toxin [Planctomycetota bacterium]